MVEPAHRVKLNDWETGINQFGLGDYDEFEVNISHSEDEDDSQDSFQKSQKTGVCKHHPHI